MPPLPVPTPLNPSCFAEDVSSCSRDFKSPDFVSNCRKWGKIRVTKHIVRFGLGINWLAAHQYCLIICVFFNILTYLLTYLLMALRLYRTRPPFKRVVSWCCSGQWEDRRRWIARILLRRCTHRFNFIFRFRGSGKTQYFGKGLNPFSDKRFWVFCLQMASFECTYTCNCKT